MRVRELPAGDDWLYGPESMSWRINSEAVMLLGGPAALLMQLAHPLVVAGVAEHSDFKVDPFGRLRRTLDVMLTILFSDRATAACAVEAVNRVHSNVRGSDGLGRPYSARDPNLMLWVFSTLVYSSVRVYEACVAELQPDEIDRYYRESVELAGMFGIPADIQPESYAGLKAWMKDRVDSGEVHVTELARELAGPILNPLPFVPRRLARLSFFVTAGLLPRPIREGYGLDLGRPGSAALALGRRMSRVVLPLVPAPVKRFPAARAAEARQA